MKKSPGAFRTISEVAGELELAQHVLRFWETKFTQLKPLKRGGKRRYYRPEDVALLRHIRSLLYEDGYTIKGVQKLLRQANFNIVESDRVRIPFKAESKADNSGETTYDKTGVDSVISNALNDLENLRKMLRDY